MTHHHRGPRSAGSAGGAWGKDAASRREHRRARRARLWAGALAAGFCGALVGVIAYDAWRGRGVEQRLREAAAMVEAASERVGAAGQRGAAVDEEAGKGVVATESAAPVTAPATAPATVPAVRETSAVADAAATATGDADELVNRLLGVAEIGAVNGATARGVVRFTATGDSLLVEAILDGIYPPGSHGLAILAASRCREPDGEVVKNAHLNPFGASHGAPNSEASHFGDLGNVEILSNGEGTLELFLLDAAYPEQDLGGWSVIVGKAVAVMARPDDMFTQPDGGAGTIIGCGVIEAPKSDAE